MGRRRRLRLPFLRRWCRRHRIRRRCDGRRGLDTGRHHARRDGTGRGGRDRRGGGPHRGHPPEDEVIDLWGDVNDVFGGGDDSDLFGLGAEPPAEPADPVVSLGDDVRLISSVEEVAADASTTTTTEPPTVERSAKVKLDGVEYSFSYVRQDKEKLDTFKLSVEIASGPEMKDVAQTKVKGTLETEVKVKNMRHSGDIEVTDGVVKHMDFSVPEMTGEINLEAKFQALSMVASMTSDPLFDLPLSFDIPVVLGGIPFTAGVGIGVQVNLSMAMLDNTLSGKANMVFDGDGGFRYVDGATSVFGKRIQDAKDLLDSVKGLAEGPVGLVFTNELPKLSLGLGYDGVKASVFLSNGYVTSFHILPSPAPCTAAVHRRQRLLHARQRRRGRLLRRRARPQGHHREAVAFPDPQGPALQRRVTGQLAEGSPGLSRGSLDRCGDRV
ncbi:MAG: hypothetical protein ACRDZ3_06595 [Acidimicrobiia bacterium]